ncbi:MAG TPA: response regulator [Gammaproteobacteria bacterium]
MPVAREREHRRGLPPAPQPASRGAGPRPGTEPVRSDRALFRDEGDRKRSVVVVDDDPAVLRSLGRLLALHGFDVKSFASPESLLAEVESLAPTCLIADLSMPGLNGLDLQRTLDERGLSYPIVFVTAYGDIRTSVQAMRRGAVDFLTKPYDQRDLLDAVARAIDARERSREESERLALLRRRLASLTVREREVFEQVAAGYLNKQIAANLGISEKTVKVHRARVMRKMSVRSLAQLARAAEQIAIDHPPPARAVP